MTVDPINVIIGGIILFIIGNVFALLFPLIISAIKIIIDFYDDWAMYGAVVFVSAFASLIIFLIIIMMIIVGFNIFAELKPIRLYYPSLFFWIW